MPMSVQSRCHDGKLLFHHTEVVLCVVNVQNKLDYIDWRMLSRLTDRKHTAEICRTFESIAQLVLACIPAGLTGRVSIRLYFCLTILSFAVNYPPFQRHALCDLDQSTRLRWLFFQQTRPVTGGEACHDNYSCYACVLLFASDATGPCHCLYQLIFPPLHSNIRWRNARCPLATHPCCAAPGAQPRLRLRWSANCHAKLL